MAEEMKIYRWVDEEGKVHFSDTAIPGTVEVQLKQNNLFTANTTNTPEAQISFADEDNHKATINYHASITSPEDDQPLRSNDGTINIHVSIEPKKENEHSLQLYLDGKKLGSPQLSPTFRALNINRGTHQVQVELLDENGKQLAQTQIITVHLLRATTN